MYTKAYGQAPSNTTLTVEYTIGNGSKDNVKSGDITDIDLLIILVKEQG